MTSPFVSCRGRTAVFSLAANVTLPLRIDGDYLLDVRCPARGRGVRCRVTPGIWRSCRRLWQGFVEEEVAWFAQRLDRCDDLVDMAKEESR